MREALLERGHWLQQAPFLAHRLELALPTDCVIGQLYRLDSVFTTPCPARQALATAGCSENSCRSLCHSYATTSAGSGLQRWTVRRCSAEFALALTAERAGAVVRTRTPVVALEKNSDGQVCGAIRRAGNVNAGVHAPWSMPQACMPMQCDAWQKGIAGNTCSRAAVCTSCSSRTFVLNGWDCCCPPPMTDAFCHAPFGGTLVGTTDTRLSSGAGGTTIRSGADLPARLREAMVP